MLVISVTIVNKTEKWVSRKETRHLLKSTKNLDLFSSIWQYFVRFESSFAESPKTKKQKVHKETQASLSLNDICEWKQSDEVAIKYCHIDQTCKNITYAQLYSTSLSISNHLQNTNASQFIGIANDVPSYCIPGLILGYYIIVYYIYGIEVYKVQSRWKIWPSISSIILCIV